MVVQARGVCMVTSSRKVGRSLAGYGGGGDYHAWDCCIVAPAPDHLSVAATCWSFPTSPFYLLQHFVQRCPFHVLQREGLLIQFTFGGDYIYQCLNIWTSWKLEPERVVYLSQKCNKWWSVGLSPLFTILSRLSHEQTPLLSSFAIFSQPCFKIPQGLSKDFTVESQLESDLLEQATFVESKWGRLFKCRS